MSLRHLLLSLALVAGIFALAGCKKAVQYKEYKVLISPDRSEYTLESDGRAYVNFKVKIYIDGVEVRDYEDNRVECEITAQGGTVSETVRRSGKQGDVYTTFYPADPENFTGGSVVAKPVTLLCKGLSFTNFSGDKSASVTIKPAL